MIDIKKIWLTDTAIWIQTADGKQACENFADYASLRNASKAGIWMKIFLTKVSLPINPSSARM